jgi:chemotaxis protein MotB
MRGGKMKYSTRTIVLLAALVFIFSGCAVPITEHQKLQSEYDKVKKERDLLATNCQELQRRNSILQVEIDKLKSEPSTSSFSQEASADLGPDLPINEKTGAVYISDSVLFSLGSSVIKDEAVPQLRKLANKLNEPKFSGYMVKVNGHTDNQPVVKTKKINKDNWFLSAKRAHAVMEKLVALGVSQDRFIISGYGPTIPLEPNQPGNKGNPRNRRVEVEVISGER